MHKTFHQHKVIFIIGCILIPFLIFFSLFYFKYDNFSFLLRDLGLPAYILTFLILAWLIFLLQHEGNGILKIYDYSILVILIIIPLILPYTYEAALNTNLHILISYIALIFLNLLLFRLHYHKTKYRNIYAMVCLFCVFHCILSMRITFLAEALYASTVSVLLTLLYE